MFYVKKKQTSNQKTNAKFASKICGKRYTKKDMHFTSGHYTQLNYFTSIQRYIQVFFGVKEIITQMHV